MIVRFAEGIVAKGTGRTRFACPPEDVVVVPVEEVDAEDLRSFSFGHLRAPWPFLSHMGQGGSLLCHDGSDFDEFSAESFSDDDDVEAACASP